MRIPSNMTEDEVLDVFEKVIKKIARKFTFGYMDLDDIKQEARVLAIQGLEKYDETRPLANFLYIHIKNRLCNYKRKHYIRLEKPCTRCPLKAFLPPDSCSLYDNMMDCKFYSRWHDRNIVKRNLSHTLEYGQVDSTNENNMKYSNDIFSEMNKKEVLDLIDKELPVVYRKHYIMLMNGIKIHKKDEELLKQVIWELLKENGYNI